MGKDVNAAIAFTNYASFFSDAKRLFLALAIIPAIVSGALALLGLDARSAFMLSYLVLFLPCLAFIAIWHLIASRKYLLSHGIVLSIVGSAVIASSILISTLISGNPLSRDALLLGLPLLLIVSYYVSYILSRNMKHAFIMALVLGAFFGIAFLGRANIDYKSLSFELLAASLFVVLISWATLQIISAPLKKRYGVTITEVVGSLLGGWFYEGEQFEEILEKIGQPIETFIGKVDVKTKEQEFSIIIPYFHFGPFGDVGASRFPSLLRKKIPNSMVLHGTATHDLNLTSKKEVNKVINTIKEKSDKPFSDKFCYSEAGSEAARAYALSFGRDVLCMVSRAPEVTEDIELSAGMILMERLKRDFEEALIADCHNSSAKKITYFSATSKEFKEYYSAIDGLKKCKERRFLAGYANTPLESSQVDDGGVSVAVFDGNEKIMLISIDANGISTHTKKGLEDMAASLGYKAIVCSTDSHGKNAVKGIVNEFKMCAEDKKKIRRAMEEAISNASKASARIDVKKLKVKVLGDKQVNEIMATLNSTWAVMKWVMPAAIILTAAGVLFLF